MATFHIFQSGHLPLNLSQPFSLSPFASSASSYLGSAVDGKSYNAPSRYQSGTPQTFRRNSTTSSPG